MGHSMGAHVHLSVGMRVCTRASGHSHLWVSVALGECVAGCVAVDLCVCVCVCVKGLCTNLCSAPCPDSRRTKCSR